MSTSNRTIKGTSINELTGYDPLTDPETKHVNEILQTHGDDKLFPGYQFHSNDEKPTSIHSIQKNILEKPLVSTREKKAYEMDIVQKYTSYGALSTFKGKEEMKQFRKVLAVKKALENVHEKINVQERQVEATKESLGDFTDQAKNAQQELVKIESEIASIVTQNGYKSRIDSDHELNLPLDIKMLSQPRIRFLVEHHGIHKSLFYKAQDKIPNLELKLQAERRHLAELISRDEASLTPMIQIINEDDVEAYGELDIVAKHRHLAYQRKIESLQKAQDRKEENELKKLQELKLARQQISNELREKRHKSEKFKEMKKSESEANVPSQASIQKEQALQTLQDHLKVMKEKYLMDKKKNAKKTIVQESVIEASKSKIREKFDGMKKKKRLKQKEIDAKKMEIVDKVLTQEFPKVKEPVVAVKEKRRKTVQFESIRPETTRSNINAAREISPAEVEKRQVAPNAEYDTILDLERDPTALVPSKARMSVPLVREKPKKAIKKELSTKCPFELDPPVAEFKDALAGKKYCAEIRVINTTASPKYFKFVKFIGEISHVASVTMAPPRSLCSGDEIKLQVHFFPNADLLAVPMIDAKIQFQSSCGFVFYLQIKYCIAKCTPMIASVGGTNLLTTDFIKPARDLTAKKHEVNQLPPLYAHLHSKSHISLMFEDCVMGDKRKIWIKLTNEGSIPTAYYVESQAPVEYDPISAYLSAICADPNTEEKFKEGPFVIRQAGGVLGSYGSKTISFTFEPAYDEVKNSHDFGDIRIHGVFLVKMEHYQEPFIIECHATTRALTMYPERSLIDFKTCLSDVFYQDRVLLWNKHKISRKFWINAEPYQSHIRGDTKVITIPDVGTIEFSPSVGFIQPNSSCLVWMKLKFCKEAVAKLEETNGEFNTTIKFGYTEQATGSERFAPLEIQASLSSSDVSILSLDGYPSVAFETVSVFERKQVLVQITNYSKFPQLVRHTDSENFKFVAHPDDVSEKVFRIAPDTTITRSICFEPKEEIAYFEKIHFKTTWNYDIEVECSGTGYFPPAFFNYSSVSFKSIPYGSDDVKRVLLERVLEGNKKHLDKGDLEFEFQKPILVSIGPTLEEKDQFGVTGQEIKNVPLTVKDKNMLNIWPRTGTICGDKGVSIEILAKVPPKFVKEAQKKMEENEKIEALSPPKLSAKGKKGTFANKIKEEEKKEEIAVEASTSQIEEPETQYQNLLHTIQRPFLTWLVPCTLQPVQSEESRLQSMLSLDSDFSFKPETTTIYLKVMVPVIDSKIQLISPLSGDCDFQAVCVGQKVSKKIIIENISSKSVKLSVNGLSPQGPFYLVKALRPMYPGEKTEVTIFFKPDNNEKFCEIADFSVGNSRISIKLSGEGVRPKLTIGAGETVKMGDVCVGDVVTTEIDIKNHSKIGTCCFFTILSSNPMLEKQWGSLNSSGTSPFSIDKYRGDINSGESITLKLSFAPDKEHDNYFDYLFIGTAGQKTMPHLIKITGKGWELSPVVLNYEEHPKSFDYNPLIRSPKQEYDRVAEHLYPQSNADAPKPKKDEVIIIPENILASSKRMAHYATFSMKWIQVQGSDLLDNYPCLDPSQKYWRLSPLEIEISNLKTLLKADKKYSGAEYSIEKVDASFKYDPCSCEYILTPKSVANNTGFLINLEPSKGTLDVGATKSLKVEIQDPTRRLLHQAYKTWNRIDNAPLNQIQTKFQRDNGSPLTRVADIVDDEAKTFRERALATEIQCPVYIEQVFRITFKGGVRFVEPKGQQLAQESRVFYVKVKANPE